MYQFVSKFMKCFRKYNIKFSTGTNIGGTRTRSSVSATDRRHCNTDRTSSTTKASLRYRLRKKHATYVENRPSSITRRVTHCSQPRGRSALPRRRRRVRQSLERASVPWPRQPVGAPAPWERPEAAAVGSIGSRCGLATGRTAETSSTSRPTCRNFEYG